MICLMGQIEKVTLKITINQNQIENEYNRVGNVIFALNYLHHYSQVVLVAHTVGVHRNPVGSI